MKTGITESSEIAETIIGSVDTTIIQETTTSTTEIITSTGTDFAINQRWEIWFESIERILERPFFGYGAGTEPTAAMMNRIGINAPHAHNIVLQLLLEGGIFALILMCLIGFRTIKNGITLMRRGYNASFWIGFAVLFFAIGFILHGMVDYPLTTPRLIACFVTALALTEQATRLYSANSQKTISTKKAA